MAAWPEILLWLKFGLVASPPLLLGCLPCRVTGIASRLLFSLKQSITFCLFGSVAGRLLGRRAFGIGYCLMRCRGCTDDACRSGGQKSLAQSLRHNKIGHVIEREGIFDPIVRGSSSAE